MNSFCQVPSANNSSNFSGTMLTNSSSISEGFRVLSDSFDCMFKRNAYVHWYTSEGMDHSEFTEAISNVRDMIAEYN